MGVGHRLLRGKGFRGDQEERRLGIKSLKRLRHIGAIHIGNKVAA